MTGEDVVIARSGKPVARLVRVGHTRLREPGAWAGRILIVDDFDDTPRELVEAFGDDREPGQR